MSVVCTSDIRICDDGSYIYRDPTNNCEFNPLSCPLSSGFTLADLHILCNCINQFNLCAARCPVFLTNQTMLQGQNVTECRLIEENSCNVNITSEYGIFCEDCRVPPPRPPSIPYPPDMPYNSNPILGLTNDPSSSLPPALLPSPPNLPPNPPILPSSPPPYPHFPISIEVLPNQTATTVLIIAAVSGVIGLIGIVAGCVLESVVLDIFKWRSNVIVSP